MTSSDNCGVLYARCLNPISNLNKYEFKLGGVIRVMPKILDFSKPLKKKKCLGLIVCLKKLNSRPQGVWLRFNLNKILCLSDSFKFLGTRVYDPLCREIRSPHSKVRYKKIISYSRVTL